jgi:hypothetical protein
MVIVLPRIAEFVVAAGALEAHLVNEMELLHEIEHAEDSGKVRGCAGTLGGPLLDFLQAHGRVRLEQCFQDCRALAGDPEPLIAKYSEDAFQGEGGIVPGHVHRINPKRGRSTGKWDSDGEAARGKMGFCVRNCKLTEMENARGKHRVGFSVLKDFCKVLQFTCSATGDDRN